MVDVWVEGRVSSLQHDPCFPSRFCFMKTVGTQELTKDLAMLEVIDEVGPLLVLKINCKFELPLSECADCSSDEKIPERDDLYICW